MGDPSAEIAGAAVTFLLQTVKQLLVEKVHLITGAKGQVEKLVEDLRFVKEFLVESASRPANNIDTRELLRDIRKNIHDAEDAIDAFVTMEAERKSKFWLFRATQKLTLAAIAKKVEAICENIDTIRGKIKEQISVTRTNTETGAPEEHKVPDLTENFVGFQDEEKQLIERLTRETRHLDVVAITGMPGIGKTTLACKIFNHPAIKHKFPIRIWVSVSDATKKAIFLGILRALGPVSEDLYRRSYEDLGRLVAARLVSKTFLIVLDDVWEAEDWQKLQIAFPKSNNLGKVLVTSREQKVANVANRSRRPVSLKQLSQDESWFLLQLQVFGKADCPDELRRHGKIIAEQCDGSPLQIVTIGDILVKKVPEWEDMKTRRNEWEKVSNSVSTFLRDYDPSKKVEMSISSSYNKLPYHLRACFLYLGMFPENFEIPVSKLVRMWIAEGLVEQKDDMTLEENAEDYLGELISRSLVRVEKRKSDGRTKSCHISYLVRDFCKTEGGNKRENFLQEVKKSSTDGDFQPPISDVEKCPRLCIHSDLPSFISRRPPGGRLRSFVSFSRAEFAIEKESTATFPAAYKLLRVLDAKPIKFNKIPGDMYLLVHLRYVTVSFSSSVLPAAFTKLLNIQTLIVHTSSPTLKIKADVLKMSQLRHLETNVPATLPKSTRSNTEGEMLQTLGTISPKSCTKEFFEKARCLKKLSVRGPLAVLLDAKEESFCPLAKLENLEMLKLNNDIGHPKLTGLPQQHYKFPPKLRSLTLSATCLNWTHISVLGSLQNLEILKLKKNAFVGDTWEAADGWFCSIEVLHIVRCTELVYWRASAQNFPKLRRLNLWKCERLREVPSGLADIDTLQLLDLRDCTTTAAASGRKILHAKEEAKLLGETASNVIPFKLCVSPDDG